MSDRYRDRQFSPDRNFSPDTQGRSPYSHPAQDEADPLAELARLIGQADPYSTFSRDYKQQAAAQSGHEVPADHGHYEDDFPPRYNEDPAYDDEPPPQPSWMRRAAAAAPAQPQYSAYDAPPAQEERPQSFNRNSNYRLGYEQPVFPPEPQHYDEQAYQHEAGYAADSRYDNLLYGEPAPQADQYGYDQDYQEQGYDQHYAEQPAPKRRGGMLTVGVVLALAVVGTAGAYAFRSFMGSHHANGEPPIIKADAGPNKIVPNNQAGNSKQIYDRVGDSGSGEKIVSREEQPVDVDGRSGGPRVVFPPLTQNASPPTTSSVAVDTRPTGPGVANGTINGDAPRAVKTLTIRPDQPDTAQAAASPVSVPPQSAAARPQGAAQRSAAPPPGAPMAIAPQAQEAPEPRSRVASLNPTASAPSASGVYVQVSSQKTESDALNSYKVLQSKYSGILGSRQATIRRADLGDKGVYYRAMVGPFAGGDDATQFCLNLQSAGGKCIVQRN